LENITIEISATAVAWYGAIVGTLALIINGLVAWRDRPRIVVNGRAGYKVTSGGSYDTNEEYIAITVANRGRRPRTIDRVGFKLRTGKPAKNILAVDSMLKGPQELTEGRSCTWYVKQREINLEDIEYIWAYDQTGKEFQGKLAKN